ncbi:MAG TPA: acyltransferase family protein [Candidatus Corynebacterium gallistercoris]|uniref:Acyltransferase family protein n=1 Tax=Candidatus Corynebacterium gallistercoris TaxID=2838530 RepID=A0A9D1UQM9_9CORY|nr:acyltransferase family protein [Candidatus Corynebacterium gallistercoris]
MRTFTSKTTEQAIATTAAPGIPRARVDWADSAKGLSIIGVCLMHVVTAIPEGTETSLGELSSFLDPLRMPLFFLVSGLFSHRILQRTLGDLWYRRLWYLLVPYLIFTPVQAAIRLDLVGNLTPESLIKAIVLGDPGLWFLYALMLYNVFAWVLRNEPPWLALLVSFLPMSIGAVAGLMEMQSFRQALVWAPMFFLGLHYREFFFRLAGKAYSFVPVVGFAALYGIAEFLIREANRTLFSEWSSTIAAVTVATGFLRSLAALPFGIIVAVWLCHTPVVSNVVGFIGRNTLPIYVSHHAALHFLLPTRRTLVESDPEMWEFFGTAMGGIWYGIGICVLSGAVFYAVGRTPVLKWVLYPPPLRRRAPVPTQA